MAATPLSKHKSPNALVSCAMPSKSTRTMEVSAMKAAVKRKKKKHKMNSNRNSDCNQLVWAGDVQEKRPKQPEAMQNPT